MTQPTVTRHCNQCSALLVSSAVFCGECGAQVAQPTGNGEYSPTPGSWNANPGGEAPLFPSPEVAPPVAAPGTFVPQSGAVLSGVAPAAKAAPAWMKWAMYAGPGVLVALIGVILGVTVLKASPGQAFPMWMVIVCVGILLVIVGVALYFVLGKRLQTAGQPSGAAGDPYAQPGVAAAPHSGHTADVSAFAPAEPALQVWSNEDVSVLGNPPAPQQPAYEPAPQQPAAHEPVQQPMDWGTPPAPAPAHSFSPAPVDSFSASPEPVAESAPAVATPPAFDPAPVAMPVAETEPVAEPVAEPVTPAPTSAPREYVFEGDQPAAASGDQTTPGSSNPVAHTPISNDTVPNHESQPAATVSGVNPYAPAAASTTSSNPDDIFAATTIVPRRNQPQTLAVVTESGQIVAVAGTVVVGRNPEQTGTGAQLVRLQDNSRSVSKTHAQLVPVAGGIEVTDLGSSNGTSVVSGGIEHAVQANQPVVAKAGDTILFGDMKSTVEAAQ